MIRKGIFMLFALILLVTVQAYDVQPYVPTDLPLPVTQIPLKLDLHLTAQRQISWHSNY